MVSTGTMELTVGITGSRSTQCSAGAWDRFGRRPMRWGGTNGPCDLLRHAGASVRVIVFRDQEIVLATSHDCLRVLHMNVRLPFFAAEIARWL